MRDGASAREAHGLRELADRAAVGLGERGVDGGAAAMAHDLLGQDEGGLEVVLRGRILDTLDALDVAAEGGGQLAGTLTSTSAPLGGSSAPKWW